MSWTSSLFACIVPLTAAADDRGARQVISETTDLDQHVFASSRNGALPAQLQQVCAASPRWQGLYLLGNESLLAGDALRQQHDVLGQLLDEIERAPSFVVEAMKERYAPTGELHMDGFHPLPFERVYPADAVVKDGWIYLYTDAQIRAMLASAPCGAQPCPDGDDEGENLEFVFALLKSHRALLAVAIERDAAVAFGEMSE
jgi:hypothetical protein